MRQILERDPLDTVTLQRFVDPDFCGTLEESGVDFRSLLRLNPMTSAPDRVGNDPALQGRLARRSRRGERVR